MRNLNELFRPNLQTNYLSVVYKGETMHLYDHVDFKKGDRLAIKILSTNSPHKQIIGLMVIEPKYKKLLQLNGIKNAGFHLSKDTFPKDGAEVEVLNDIKLSIGNAWQEADSSIIWRACQNAAMKIKVNGNTRTYYCNDGDHDEDFDDLIFEIKVNSRNDK